jgi:zinc transport system substrate-binding protein
VREGTFVTATGRTRGGLGVSAILLTIALVATTAVAAGATIRAFAGIPPIEYAVDRIGGEHVATNVLVPPGQSPHSFDATPRQMVALAESDVYFSIGLPFERGLLGRIEELNPNLAVVDVGHGVPRRRFADDHHEDERNDAPPHEDADDEAEHDHVAPAALPDPHVWLSPRLFRIQARNVMLALVEIDPEHADEYRESYVRLIADLNALDAEIAEALAPIRGRSVYVFHPAFGYFTDTYGLKQVAVETGGSEPGARDLARLIEQARADGVRVIFVQPQFAARSAEAVAREIGGAVVPIDPLAYDVVGNLGSIAGKVRAALSPDEH